MFIRAGDVFYQSPEGDAAPETFAGNSRSVVAFDMDGDGDLDLAVNNFAGPPVLLENLQKARGNHWLEVRLRGKSPNTRAVGAVIEAKVGKKTMRRLVTLGNGYLGQDGPLVHFGLGRARKTDLHISWPDGTEQWIRGVKADAVVEVTQAAGGGPG
jgi:hypothetical protein